MPKTTYKKKYLFGIRVHYHHSGEARHWASMATTAESSHLEPWRGSKERTENGTWILKLQSLLQVAYCLQLYYTTKPSQTLPRTEDQVFKYWRL